MAQAATDLRKIDADALPDAGFGTQQPSLMTRWHLRNIGPGKGAASDSRALRLRKHLRKTRPVLDTVYNDLKLRLYPGENVCDLKITIFGTHPVETEYAQAQAYLAKAQTFVDIGANIGLYSLMARKILPAGAKILAFEPDPRTVQKLRQNLAFNAANDDVTVINAAVGRHEETLTLHTASRNNAGRNTLQADLAQGDADAGVPVPVRPLVAYLADYGIDKIDFLKIDIEGFEAEALAPFFETAPDTAWPDYIMIEVVAQNLWQVDLVAMLKERGYRVAYQTKDDMHFERVVSADPSDTR